MTQRKNAVSKGNMVATGQAKDDSGWVGGGQIPGAEGEPAFVARIRRNGPLPILISVPHGGRHYPTTLTENLRDAARSSLRLEDRMIDLVAEKVAADTGAGLIIARAPRAMIDLNRSVEDMDWDMVAGSIPAIRPRLAAGRRSRSGLGLVPRRLQGLGELWKKRLSREDLEARIALVHRPYHQTIGQSLEGLRDRWGSALLLDLHSMPPLGKKRGQNSAADFVLGDRFGGSCDGGLVQTALNEFDKAGRLAAHNRPYAGGYVLDRHGAPSRSIHALQIEVCRAAYLDSELREPGAGLDEVVNILARLVRRLAAELAARNLPEAQAAE